LGGFVEKSLMIEIGGVKCNPEHFVMANNFLKYSNIVFFQSMKSVILVRAAWEHHLVVLGGKRFF
jgi:hypothetical protein